MKKNTYRSIEVQKVTAAQIMAQVVGAVVVFALDVAKKRVLLAITEADGALARLVHFQMPAQLGVVFALARELTDAGKEVQFVLEPTGTYGAPIAEGAHRHGHAVFMLSPKHTHDAASLFDNTPSKHDPKDACVIARLHAQRLARPWEPMPEERRELRAMIAERELFAAPLGEHLGRAEAMLANWWPELLQVTDIHRLASVQRWLVQYPDPASVRAHSEVAAKALRDASRGRLAADTIDEIVKSAQGSQGAVMSEGERRLVRVTFEEIRRLSAHCDEVDARIEAAIERKREYATTRKMVGAVTTAVIVAKLGEVTRYASAHALEKAIGLNLKEHSSGVRQNMEVHITKRGPGMVRKYLYMTAMRLVATDAVVRAWYQRRASFRAGNKSSALVAVMRKLARALWHVAKGEAFDAKKLFDERRLDVVPIAPRRRHQGAAEMTASSSEGGVSVTA